MPQPLRTTLPELNETNLEEARRHTPGFVLVFCDQSGFWGFTSSASRHMMCPAALSLKSNNPTCHPGPAGGPTPPVSPRSGRQAAPRADSPIAADWLDCPPPTGVVASPTNSWLYVPLLHAMCAAPRCHYLLRALPPCATAAFARRHDEAVLTCLGALHVIQRCTAGVGRPRRGASAVAFALWWARFAVRGSNAPGGTLGLLGRHPPYTPRATPRHR